MRYDFIRRQQKAYSITTMCQVMEVSRSGFYQYLKNIDKNRIDPEFEAMSAVRQIHNQTRGRYGSRRMSKELRSKGYDIGRYAARRLMIKTGVTVKLRKKFIKTTDSWKSCQSAVSGGSAQPDLVQRFVLFVDDAGLVVPGGCD